MIYTICVPQDRGTLGERPSRFEFRKLTSLICGLLGLLLGRVTGLRDPDPSTTRSKVMLTVTMDKFRREVDVRFDNERGEIRNHFTFFSEDSSQDTTCKMDSLRERLLSEPLNLPSPPSRTVSKTEMFRTGYPV